ncbi:MAG TPA: carboxypeptidase-like regulatory domain-containing protein [Chitinophagaceae bacterium]|nr:carboxypeptidase-like regulatory domain-containing protein [Chitinophagaceae bacterium]
MKFVFSILTALALLVSGTVSAQLYKIKGTVYDSTRNFPMEAVSVLSSSGTGTITNSDGQYEIEVKEKDSIWFSYLNKPTKKFAVLKIANPFAFDISIQVSVQVMKEVQVLPRSYKLDSIRNREDYAKIFNFQKPKLKPSISGMGVGFDLDEIINMFRVRRNKSMLAFKERLLNEEREKAVDHRFNKALVRRLTMLEGNELDSFMLLYRPSYQFTMGSTDYDFQQYIKTAFYRFRRGLTPQEIYRKEEE